MAAEPSAGTSTTAADRLDRAAAEIGRCSVGVLLGLLCLAALMVVWRRAAGALSHPLPSSALVAVGMTIAAVAVGIRLIGRFQSPTESPPAESPPTALNSQTPSIAILTTATVLALGVALSLPGTTAGGLAAFWAVLIVEEFWAWRPGALRLLRRGSAAPRPVRFDRAERHSPHQPPAGTSPTPTQPETAFDSSAIPPGDVLQQLTRSLSNDGVEQLAGWLRMPFSVGQRTASVHVAFCPPFSKTPELSVEQLDGPTARIKTAQLLPHGARLDLKLAATAEEPSAVLLKFSARE